MKERISIIVIAVTSEYLLSHAFRNGFTSGDSKERFGQTLILFFCFFFLMFLTGNTVSASEFGNRFNDWLLGDQVQADVDRLEPQVLEEASRQCLSCHNGNRANRITPKAAGAPLHFQGATNSSHPVGMDYDLYASRKPRAYKSQATLVPAVRLVNGRVSCISCHTLKQKTQVATAGFVKVRFYEDQTDLNCTASGELTVGPRTTDLCLACHIT